MKKLASRKILSACLLGLILLVGCKELTQPDLTDKQMNLTAPVDNLVTSNNSNTFAWEAVEGASLYQIQIVSPKFDSVVRFVTDSSLNKTTFSYTLIPGIYQWRVRAINAGSASAYFKRTITIQ